MATFINDRTAQALRGESVIVTVPSSDWATVSSSLAIGDEILIPESGNLGTVGSIDSFGLTFEVVPFQPDFRFDGANPGLLTAGETISY